jgi:hypothetical protein
MGGRRGSESRRRPASICARRDAATCGRDSPAPSTHLRPRPAIPVAPLRAPGGEDPDVGRTQHPKTEAAVTSADIVAATVGRARIAGKAVPRPTAQHPGLAFLLGATVAILHPLPNIAVHVMQAPFVRLELSDWGWSLWTFRGHSHGSWPALSPSL